MTREELAGLALATQAVHAGEARAVDTSVPTVHPIHLSNTFLASGPEEMDAILGGAQAGFTYGRHGNPTVRAFEEAVAALEGGEDAQAYSSGMAALHGALLGLGVRAGDTVVVSRDLYGATISLVRDVLGRLGVRCVLGDLTDLAQVEGLLAEHRPRAVVAETLSNPLLRVLDGPGLVRLCHAYGAAVLVDNTFTTPVLSRPLSYGADAVVHSATKYLGGHGDAIGGVVVGTRELVARLHQDIKLLGAILGPVEAYLLHRGLKTLPLRMARQCSSARALAERLAGIPGFGKVHHPSLPSHPDHERAQGLFPHGWGGAVVTVDLGCTRDGVLRFLQSLRLVVRGTTVGDVYTLCLYPWMASHRNLPLEERLAAGITEGMVRIAVGLEEVEDLVTDLLQARAAV